MVYDECPILADLPLSTEGFVCVGAPVGHESFIHKLMEERLVTLQDEFNNLLPYPYPHDFLLFVRYCCNQKIVHLLRHFGPQILTFS